MVCPYVGTSISSGDGNPARIS
ncbi:MAG: hypothetical protein QOH97_958, partial [Actinoplanes sp.]|nr:hypothetical protein [Actinoplanes sp.]